jgi:hypothetical protein
MEIFEKYNPGFMQVFLDDFTVFKTRKTHLQHLEMCLKNCRDARLNLNQAKCAFVVTSGMLLRHILSKDGIAMHPDKVKAIL